MRFAGQHAIITGGSSGIGKAIAYLLAQEGAHLSLIARDPARLETARHEIEAVRADPNQRILTFSADVADPEAAARSIQAAIEANGPPDLLITSAGIAHPGHFCQLPLDIHTRTMAVNYFGTLCCIQAALPAMEARGRGRIALISSGAGLIGLYGYTPYAPTKFALRGLAESLRAELKPLGIRVSIVYPPDTDTPQLAQENKTKPEATKRITGTAKMWSAEGVARVTMRGIEQGRFAITPGLEMTLLFWLHSLLGPALNRYFDRIVARTPPEE